MSDQGARKPTDGSQYIADVILDDLFHGCALTAYLDEADTKRHWPESEPTRRRAFDYYESALAAKNGTACLRSSSSEPAQSVSEACRRLRDSR